MQWDGAQTWWGCPCPAKSQWSSVCLCSIKALLQRHTRAVTWQPPSNLIGKTPSGRWQLSDPASVPTALHASWPLWLTYACTIWLTPVPPGWAHIPVEPWLDWHLVEVRGMDDSLTLPLSGYWQDDNLTLPQSGHPIPTEEDESVWGLTGRLGQKDGVPPPNPPIGSLEDGGMSPVLLPPPYVVAAPQSC